MRFRQKIIAGSLGAGIFAWFMDAILDYFFFFEGGFLELLITDVPAHELYYRSFTFVLFLSFGFIFYILTRRLESSHQEFQLLFDDAPLGIFQSTSDGQILKANSSLAAIMGCESSEQVKSEFTDLAHEFYVNPDRRREFIEELKSRGEVEHFEVRGKQLDGTKIWVNLEAKISSQRPDGSFVIDGYLTDITARRKARERVAHLNRVISAIRNINQLIIREDDREKLIDDACDLLVEDGGYSCSAIVLFDDDQEPAFVATAGLEDNNLDLAEEYKAEKAMPCREEALKSSSPVIEDYKGEKCEECPLVEKCKSGRAVMVRLDYEDNIYGLMTVFVPDKFSNLDEELDLLEEEAGDLGFAFSSIEAEEELARTKENLRVTFDSVGDGLISTDTEGRVARMNSVAEELTGWPLEEARGEALEEVFEIVNTHSRKPVKNPAEKVLATDKVVGLGNDTTLIGRDGSEYQIANSGAPIKKPDGEIIGVVMVFSDISEKYKLQEKIKQSEKRYRSLFSRMNEGMALHEIVRNEAGEPVDYKILDVNSRFEEILDLDKEQVVGRKATEVYETEQPPYFERYLAVARENAALDFETYFPSADKHFHISAFSPEEGKFATVFSDITDRVRTKNALERSEMRYRRLFETAQDGMLIVDATSGKIKDANPFIQEILGYSKEELIGEKLWNMGTFRHVVENHQRFDELIDKGYIRYEDLPLEDKSGREVPVEFVSNTYETGDEEVLQCNIRDISQRKEAEERFKESHRQLQTLFGNLPGIAYRCLYDEDWTMQFISEGCWKLTGYESDELLGSDSFSYNEIIHPEDREKVRKKVQNGINNDEPFEMVYRIQTKEEGIKWVREQGEGVFDKTGEVKFLEGLITDVTEREKTKFKLEETVAEKETMLQEIHHRVKNNLQVICSLLDMQKQQADEAAQKALADAHSRVYSMALVHENIYRTESLAEIEIQNYLQKLINLIEQSQGHEPEDIQINRELEAEITLQLETAIPCALILNELISNAYEHAFPADQKDPRISVIFKRTEQKKYNYRMEIKDNGQGLPEDIEIRESFSEHLGLGLVRSLVVNQLRGDFDFESSPGEGTQYTIQF